jgi:hypothetical protein
VKKCRPNRAQRTQAGIALLISIFVLLLISVVAIALIVASGTESALAGNYRSSSAVYYAAAAGLEEARGRLFSKSPNSISTAAPGFLPPPNGTLPIGKVLYILNPAPGDPANTLAAYPDNEYANEFGAPPNPGNVTTISSVWNIAPLSGLGIPGPLYKWVRINAVSEISLNNLDTYPYDGTIDPTPVFYDGTRLNDTGNGSQVMEITALAQLPNGSQKTVQYLAAPASSILPPFPAAVTLLGNNVDYTGPLENDWSVSGNDTIDLENCTHGLPVWGIGYYNGGDASYNNITGSGAVATSPYKNNYTGQGGTIPNVGNISGSIPANFQKPSQLDALVQSITQIADAKIPGPATGSNLPAGMSAANLMTVVVNGDLDLTGWHNQGYGLLLVTGNLTYDPDASWYGIVLVIGQGYMTGDHSGSGQIVGGMLLAKTRDLSGSLFPDPNLPSSAGGGYAAPDYRSYGSNIQFKPNMGNGGANPGIYYSSCWIKAATPGGSYQVRAFHEISQ